MTKVTSIHKQALASKKTYQSVERLEGDVLWLAQGSCTETRTCNLGCWTFSLLSTLCCGALSPVHAERDKRELVLQQAKVNGQW